MGFPVALVLEAVSLAVFAREIPPRFQSLLWVPFRWKYACGNAAGGFWGNSIVASVQRIATGGTLSQRKTAVCC
jgi:hypothetical protein